MPTACCVYRAIVFTTFQPHVKVADKFKYDKNFTEVTNVNNFSKLPPSGALAPLWEALVYMKTNKKKKMFTRPKAVLAA